MPRLLRLRLVSVGHTGARFDDLLLDLRDRTGEPTDSTLWLRNGGGKTSLLSLFFALVRPDKREFLGLKVTGKNEGRPNELKDFILPDDRAVVVGEWMLDGGASLFDDKVPQRYLAGVFYERRSGAEDDLQRLFFAGYTAADNPALQLDGLPLYTSAERRARRTLGSFRQEWLALREQHPALQVMCTENQREWAQTLDSVGVDTELFAYQLRMNRRESGADELFRFSDHDRFIDFLLEVAHTTELGDKLRQNLGTLRRELIERKDRILPEQELISGLVERVAPLIEVAHERQRHRKEAGQVAATLDSLRRFATGRLAELNTAREAKLRAQRAAVSHAEQAKREADLSQRRAAELRLHLAWSRQLRAQEDLERLNKSRDEALRQRYLWEAAGPLRSAIQAEQRAEAHRRVLENRQHEHAPLLLQTEQAAVSFAAALVHEAAASLSESEQHDAVASAAEELGKRAIQDAATARSELQRLTADLAHHSAALREIDHRRAQLVAAGSLQVAESTSAALTRLGAARQGAESAQESAQAEATQHRAESDRLRDERHAAEIRKQEAETQATACARLLAEARSAEHELCASPLLGKLFQIGVTEVRLEPLLEQALVLLPKEAGRLEQELMTCRTELAGDERACFALQQTELLPPSPEVEAVLARLPRAWSGWQYLAKNAPNNLARRERVAAAPHLAAGVIVRDEDFAQATAVLTQLVERPDVPVAVGRASALLETAANKDWQVVGPQSDAYFDPLAGRAELTERRTKITATQRKLTELGQLREDIEQLRHRLTEFRRRWPPGWCATTESEQRTAETQARINGERMAEIADAVQESRRLEEQAQLAGQNAAGAARKYAEAILRVQSFAQDHEAQADKHRQKLQEAEAQTQDRTQGLKRAEEEEQVHGERARAARAQAERGRRRAQQLEDERGRIRHADSETPPLPGQLDELRARYQECRDLYEQRIGQDGLENLRQRELDQARAARHELARKLDAAKRSKEGGRLLLTAEEVETALRTLSDFDRLEARQQDANDAYTSAHGSKARQDQELQNVNKLVADADKKARELGLEVTKPKLPLDPAATEAEASAAEADIQRYLDAIEAGRLAATAAGEEAQRLGLQHDKLQAEERLLSSLSESYDDVFKEAALGSKPEQATDMHLTDAVAAQQTTAVQKRLAELRSGQQALSARRHEVVRQVRSHAKDRRFDDLNSSIAQRFADALDADLEISAATLHGELVTRLKALTEQLASLDRHREFLIDIALEAAREGLKLIDAAASSSRIPNHVPGLGGVHFLRISQNTPSSHPERRARIGQLIDRVLSEKELPGGLGLVQQAVRELAKPIRARVLNPDPTLEQRSVEIPELARFSGGERLTCAVLLYCTLAQLRARTRGDSRLPSSVLFLDNPIGASSRVKFLDIQRDVAQAMRIQLIYTTGVNDLDALATLPNVIRLRNERIDRARGHRHVEHSAVTERQVVGARILLPNPASPAPTEGP